MAWTRFSDKKYIESLYIFFLATWQEKRLKICFFPKYVKTSLIEEQLLFILFIYWEKVSGVYFASIGALFKVGHIIILENRLIEVLPLSRYNFGYKTSK